MGSRAHENVRARQFLPRVPWEPREPVWSGLRMSEARRRLVTGSRSHSQVRLTLSARTQSWFGGGAALSPPCGPRQAGMSSSPGPVSLRDDKRADPSAECSRGCSRVKGLVQAVRAGRGSSWKGRGGTPRTAGGCPWRLYLKGDV